MEYTHVGRAARRLGVSSEQVRRLVAQGRLRATLVDGVRLIELVDLDRLIAERAVRRGGGAADGTRGSQE
jgi:excisionase family DNA binding protein